MAGWLDRLWGKPARMGRLPALLSAYPPYRIPHPGSGWSLTLPQAETNLAYLLDHKAERLGIVGDLLARFDLDLGAGLVAPNPKPFLDAVWRWTAQEWPSIYDPALATIGDWLNSPREGAHIVFSLVMDVAIALGEMVLVRRPDYGWALDLDPENRGDTEDDSMLTWQRPVVMRPADEIVPAILLDSESAARSAYIYCSKPAYGVEIDLGRGVLDAISGAHERFWREEAARRAP